MIEAICWVLIHSLWQGLLLALAGGGVILCTKRSPAAVRYRLLCGLFFLFLGVVGMTFFYEWGLVSVEGKVYGEGGVGLSAGWLSDFCSAHAGQVVVIWVLVAAFKSLRLAAGWGYLRTVRRDGMAGPSLWVERVGSLSRQLGIRRTVKMVESGLVKVPMVMGHLRPVIFIPLGLINHLPAEEMEAVVLHELAHIRRRDQLVNILQQVAECLLFFNPGVIWISSLMREERENCCDDTAIAHTRDRVGFVRALVRFKEHSLREVALAFPGNRRQLFHRVLRISKQENRGLGGRERLILLICSGLLLLWLAAVQRVGSTAKPQGSLIAVTKGAPVPAEVVSVLKAKQQVTENMEWVEAQLAQLHQSDVKSRKRKGGGQAERNRGQVIRDREQGEKNREEDRFVLEEEDMKQLQLVRNEELARWNREQAQRNEELVRRKEEQDRVGREQAENKAQDLRNQQQAEQNRVQAERDREQADRDRQQAERDRAQAELDRQQAERDREQAERDRQQAQSNRMQAEKERDREALERARAEKDRQQADLKRLQTAKMQADRAQADAADKARIEAAGKADAERKDEVKN